MRKIKFRGVCPNTDEVVVGSLLILHNEWFIVQSVSYQPPYASSSFYHTIQIYPSRTKKEHILAYPVDPDTVEQFVGYDADGKEVYEGDTLIEHWKPYVECLPEEIVKTECKIRLTTRITVIDTNGGGYELNDKRKVFKLKERGENENLS